MSAGLASAVAGGAAASAAGVALPWLLGALGAASLLALCGLRLAVADYVRKAGQVVAGFSVGLFFTPEVGARVLELGWAMVASGLCSILASVAISLVFARAGGCDRGTAYFAMLPGGMAEMAGLARQFDANVTLVSLSQMLRVVVIVLTVPAVLLQVFAADAHTSGLVRPEMDWGTALLGMGAAAALSWMLQRLRVFNAWLLGGLALGIALGMLQPDHLYAPHLTRVFAQVAIGAALGARFELSVLRKMRVRFLPITILATLLLIGVNLLLAMAFGGELAVAAGMLATAPGGIAEMSLMAEALHLSPPIVTAWQLVRILLVAVLAGPLYKIYQVTLPRMA